jgi:hypothetical protein
VAVWLPILLLIQGVMGSDLSQKIGYSNREFREFTSFLYGVTSSTSDPTKAG